MDPVDTLNEGTFSGSKGMKISMILIAAFLIYYSVLALLSPGKKMKVLYDEFAPVENAKSGIDQKIVVDSVYLSILKEKAFLQARVEMAETDSVYLTINIPDSTINLEISGVTVHSIRVSEMQVSRLLKNGDRFTIFSLLSSPLTIQKEISSIKKEPLMIAIAPKDTSEFQPDVIPDTTDTENVNYILELDHGIRLHFYQAEDEGRFSTAGFDFRDRFINLGRSMSSVVQFRIPEYYLYIKFRLPKADAKIIYRAIPEKGQVAISM